MSSLYGSGSGYVSIRYVGLERFACASSSAGSSMMNDVRQVAVVIFSDLIYL